MERQAITGTYVLPEHTFSCNGSFRARLETGVDYGATAEVVFLALFAYAAFYGWVLFIAGWLSSLFAAMWIRDKLRQVEKLLA
jgi:hypothetical protein